MKHVMTSKKRLTTLATRQEKIHALVLKIINKCSKQLCTMNFRSSGNICILWIEKYPTQVHMPSALRLICVNLR